MKAKVLSLLNDLGTSAVCLFAIFGLSCLVGSGLTIGFFTACKLLAR